MNKIIYIIIILLFFNKLLNIQIPKVSIIIPSYNIIKYNYLESSIKSVLNQTLKNIELIIVDDNANDLTPIILDNYTNLDHRIITIHKSKNEMTGFARNTGLDFIMGEYLSFLDYDDIFHRDALKLAYKEAVKKNYVVVNFEYKIFNEENQTIKYLNDKNNKYKIEKLNKEYNFPLKKTGIHIWRNIYKSSFIIFHNFKFVNTWADEDVLFCMTIFSFEFEILLIKKPLIFHRILKTSIGHNLKKLNVRQNLFIYHLKNIFKIFKKYKIVNNRIRENIFVLLGKSHFKKRNIEKLLKFINGYKNIFSKNIIRKYYINIYNMKKLDKLYKYKEININFYEKIIIKKLNCEI